MAQTRLPPDRSSPPSMPRWVKAIGIAFLVLVVVVIVLHLTGNSLGGHEMHGMFVHHSLKAL